MLSLSPVSVFLYGFSFVDILKRPSSLQGCKIIFQYFILYCEFVWNSVWRIRKGYLLILQVCRQLSQDLLLSNHYVPPWFEVQSFLFTKFLNIFELNSELCNLFLSSHPVPDSRCFNYCYFVTVFISCSAIFTYIILLRQIFLVI